MPFITLQLEWSQFGNSAEIPMGKSTRNVHYKKHTGQAQKIHWHVNLIKKLEVFNEGLCLQFTSFHDFSSKSVSFLHSWWKTRWGLLQSPRRVSIVCHREKIKLPKICTLEISKKNIHFPVLFYFYPLTKVKLSSNQLCMKKHVLTVWISFLLIACADFRVFLFFLWEMCEIG